MSGIQFVLWYTSVHREQDYMPIFLAVCNMALGVLVYTTRDAMWMQILALAIVKTVGRWNTYDVLSRGSRIEVRVNGTLTATLDDADPSPGFIALQHWRAGEVRFRSLILTPLEN